VSNSEDLREGLIPIREKLQKRYGNETSEVVSKEPDKKEQKLITLIDNLDESKNEDCV